MRKSVIAIVAIGMLAISNHAHAGVNFSKPSMSSRSSISFTKQSVSPRPSINLAKPSMARPTPIQRPIIAQRPVIVQRPTSSRNTSSGLNMGHVAVAAGLAGLAGYAAASNAHPAQTIQQPVQQYGQQQYAQNQQMFVPSVPGNKIVTCQTPNGVECNYNDGFLTTKISVKDFAKKSGYNNIVSQAVSFQNGKQYFIIEVN